MDLARLIEPYAVDAPRLGSILVDARTATFEQWLEAGDRQKRWTDGRAFVRLMLMERTKAPSRERISADAAGSLDDNQLDAIATAVLDVASREAGGPAAGGSPSPNEPASQIQPGSERLLEFFRGRAATSSAQRGKVTDYLQRSVQRVLDQQRAIDQLRPPFGISQEMVRQLRRADEHGQALGQIGLAVQTHLERLRQHGAASQAALDELQRQGSRAVAVFDNVRRQGATALTALEELRRSAGVAWQPIGNDVTAIRSSYFELQDRIAWQLNDPNSSINRLRHILELPGSTSFALPPDLGTWSRNLNRVFDLSLSAATLAAASSISAGRLTEVDRAVNAVSNLLRPGFYATAAAGLGGLAGQGAVADILARYDQQRTAETPVFSAVLDGIRIFDTEEPSAELVEEVLQRAEESIGVSEPSGFLKAYGVSVLMGVLGIAVSLATSVWYGEKGNKIAREGIAVSREGISIAKESAQNARAGATSAELELLASEVRKDAELRQTEAAAARSIRYVHGPARLRAAPGATERVLRPVYPDQPVEVLETEGEWAKVAVYDYGSEMPLIGWISRRVLRLTPAR